MLSLDRAEFRYEPFPIGLVKPVMDETAYNALVDNYPPIELFEHFHKGGHKHTLSEKFHGREYHDFIASNPVWKEFHAWIKSEHFIDSVEKMLRDNFIDLGLDERHISTAKRLRRSVSDLGRGRLPRPTLRLRSRFEFSMLPADGGEVVPHTDTPKKIITLIVSMVRDGEWQPSWGGGTEVDRAKDRRYSFNWLNQTVPYEAIEPLHTYEFTPNQCVVFVKTFNSLHCVRRMTGVGSKAMRRTLTINIEHDE
jgi:hypothetical protein